MKLIRLKVEHFRCIRKSQVDFGAGLNVLYGPNDLGKSSLAAAIRAALLMQATSAGAQEFDCWHGGGDAHVELTFETGPQRIWRVEKRFGNRPQSYLYESRDGVDFHREADGRTVDGRLSEILRWGLTAPGGKGRRSGMPVTFLSSAFLAEQDQVSAIFKQALSGDSEESGKKRLIEVLQAVAEDPLFKSVLQLVQVKVAEAFSSSGQRKRGKDSPWMKIQEQIKRAQEEERQCGEQLHKTVAIESELQALLNQRVGLEEELRRRSDELETARADYDRADARRAVLARLEESKIRLSGITASLEKLAAEKRRRDELKQFMLKVTAEEETAKATLSATAERLARLKEELRATSADRQREHQLRRNTLERDVADLRSRRMAQDAAIGQARTFEAAAVRTRKLETEERALSEKISAQKTRHEEASRALRELDGMMHLIARNLAMGAVEEAERGLAQAQSWREEAEGYRIAAANAEKALKDISLPPATEINALKQLETKLQVARAKLGVGLQVVLKPKRQLSIAIGVDGGEPVARVMSQELRTDASSEILLEIADVAEIRFAGGSESARAEAARLQEQWSRLAEPVLKRTNLGSLDDVAEAAREYAAKSEEIQTLRKDASALEQRIRDQRDWASVRAEQQRELDRANESLRGFDRTSLPMKNATASEASLNQLRLKRPKLMASERSEESALTIALAQLVEKQNAIATAKTEAEQARSVIQGYSETLLAELVREQEELSAALQSAEGELEAMGSAGDSGLAELRKAVDSASQNHAGAEVAHAAAVARLQAASGELASVTGGLKILEETAAQLDDVAARTAVGAIEAELALLPSPACIVTEASLEGLQSVVKSLRDQLAEVEASIQAKRGALEQVGGQVAKERMESAQEALTQLRDHERDVETDYAAWALLRETLLEAEQQEGVHLGRALGGPIVQRFTELTNGRYGKFTLGPDLETNTITVAGEGRAVDALSVGTRDQLSIIFRLTLAEQLQSAVVLDDQLTQSDGQRMSWISDFIRQMAKNIQIVVLTCRPGDYLTEGQLKGGRKADAFSQWFRAVDLTQVIERSSSSG